MTINSKYVIAIGASAGGMEEIHHFFDNTPLDQVSYIIVQHLSPDFKSRMVELLSRHSKLVVTEAEEGMFVEPNKVYFIPAKQFMTLHSGRLHLTEKENVKPPHLTINVFLDSLAKECGDKAIAVILSGFGYDGSEGITEIKKAGGMVIARNPANAEFGAMPVNAIATGMVDYILEPEAMPDIIASYVKAAGAIPITIFEDKGEEEILKDILELMKEQLPHDFSEYKPATLLRRIKKRSLSHHFSNLDNYVSFIKINPDEVKALAQDFFISVTTFFRDKEAFEVIEKKIIPDILDSYTAVGGEIKFWVAGCATGEEAYSLAILLFEQLQDEDADAFVRIFATDIDNNALAFAKKGVYSENAVKNISPERIEKFFTKEGNEYKINSKIRKMLIFAQHDVTKNPPYCNMNFISCRNVLIYMSIILQKKIYRMLHFGLKKEGYLFLGASENVNPEEDGLELINSQWKIYKNTDTKKVTRFDDFSIPSTLSMHQIPVILPRDEPLPIRVKNLADSVNEALVADLNYLVVCTNEQNQVVQTYGDTAKFLLQKNFNLNLEDLLTQPLALAFNNAKVKALHSGNKVVVNGIRPQNNSHETVRLQVTPLSVIQGNQKMLMVILSDDKINGFAEAGEMFNTNAFNNQYTLDREEEVREVKEKLYLTNEKLEAAVENMQSFNEELLSSNEEMQSSNEEMQSLIEELHTVNKDYQLKNKELNDINDDLNNYFKSNQNGQLFVDSDLLLVKFSLGTVKHINLVASDVGRPISNISTNIRFDAIVEDIKDVIKNSGTITREVESIDGKCYQLRILPYTRQTDNTISGAIISFTDISSLKETQKDLGKAIATLKLINSDLNNFVYAASHDLLGPLGNIESIVNIIRQKLVPEVQMPEYLEMIDISVKKFRVLLKELAAVGKVEGEMFVMEPVNINELLEDIRLSVSGKIESTHTVITTDFEVLNVYFSKKNLRSLLYNLIMNAIKYKSEERNPLISISTRKEKDYVILSVRDNGVGISKDKINRVFNLYSRIKTEVEGQGIGLYLAKKIIDAAGGKVTVESEPGTGSTFTLYFSYKAKNELSQMKEENRPIFF